MTAYQGTEINPKDGVTIICEASGPPCLPFESVRGHGSSAKEALEAARDKYKKSHDGE